MTTDLPAKLSRLETKRAEELKAEFSANCFPEIGATIQAGNLVSACDYWRRPALPGSEIQETSISERDAWPISGDTQ
jgi:hypothetical protein